MTLLRQRWPSKGDPGTVDIVSLSPTKTHSSSFPAAVDGDGAASAAPIDCEAPTPPSSLLSWPGNAAGTTATALLPSLVSAESLATGSRVVSSPTSSLIDKVD